MSYSLDDLSGIISSDGFLRICSSCTYFTFIEFLPSWYFFSSHLWFDNTTLAYFGYSQLFFPCDKYVRELGHFSFRKYGLLFVWCQVLIQANASCVARASAAMVLAMIWNKTSPSTRRDLNCASSVLRNEKKYEHSFRSPKMSSARQGLIKFDILLKFYQLDIHQDELKWIWQLRSLEK